MAGMTENFASELSELQYESGPFPDYIGIVWIANVRMQNIAQGNVLKRKKHAITLG